MRGKNQTPQLSYQRDFVVLAVHVLMMPCICIRIQSRDAQHSLVPVTCQNDGLDNKYLPISIVLNAAFVHSA